MTERVLRRLGRPRWLWLLLWSAIPLVSPMVFITAVRISGGTIAPDEILDVFVTQAVLAYACFVFLTGVAVLGRQAVEARDDVLDLVPGGAVDLFRSVGSIRGPLVLTAAVVAIAAGYQWAQYGPVPPLAILPLLFAYMTGIQTFVFVYLVILADLDRLGRRPLALDRFPEDRTLGLDKLGSVASTGLGFLLVAAVPLLLAGADEPVTLGVSLAVVASAVGVFVLSMWRLHRQMAAAKARHAALARRLYREAYAPLREAPTTERLEAQAGALRAAQSLDDRAQGLPTWPISEGTVRFIAVVVTGVVTSVIVRGLFAALGF